MGIFADKHKNFHEIQSIVEDSTEKEMTLEEIKDLINKLRNEKHKEIYMDNIMSIRETAMEYGIQDMGLDEINAEINAVRKRRQKQ